MDELEYNAKTDYRVADSCGSCINAIGLGEQLLVFVGKMPV